MNKAITKNRLRFHIDLKGFIIILKQLYEGNTLVNEVQFSSEKQNREY